jgi:hypothetical protein
VAQTVKKNHDHDHDYLGDQHDDDEDDDDDDEYPSGRSTPPHLEARPSLVVKCLRHLKAPLSQGIDCRSEADAPSHT